jgi:hypothetical protein
MQRGKNNGNLKRLSAYYSNTSLTRTKMMRTSALRSSGPAAIALPALFFATFLAAPAVCGDQKVAQLSRVTASGTHTCGEGKDRVCVVSGSFGNCADAQITLKTRDCCSTTPQGGTSSGFVLNYCIPDRL